MKPPWFWGNDAISARTARAMLTPASTVYAIGQRARRALTRPVRVDVPVICIGNATLGGVGKTPFAIALADLIRSKSESIFFLSRGYGGARNGPHLVRESDAAADVGDEPLLLARAAPTIVSKNRVAGAVFAVSEGASLIILDDGHQNPTLAKDVSILLVDAENCETSGPTFPAGPYRESIAHALDRADVLIEIRPPESAPLVETAKPVFRAFMGPTSPIDISSPAIAFSGIGRPQKFFDMLLQHGVTLSKTYAFPDHHAYADLELSTLKNEAKARNARLITTEKDFARIAPADRDDIEAIPATMRIENDEAFLRALIEALDRRRPGWNTKGLTPS